MTTASSTHEAPPRSRRALAWAFPTPVTIPQMVWAFVTLSYAVVVVTGAAYEAHWLVNFDSDDGAPIPILTLGITAPTGWLGFALSLPVAAALQLGDDADVYVTWALMAAFGLVQAWAVWRVGMSVTRIRARRAPA